MNEQKINLNTAAIEELTQLFGIGSALAERIIDYRESVHPFEEPIEITAVPGISERIYRVIADRVTVAPLDEGAEAEVKAGAEAEGAGDEVALEEDLAPAALPAPAEEEASQEEQVEEESPAEADEAPAEEAVSQEEQVEEESPAEADEAPAETAPTPPPPRVTQRRGRFSWLWAALLGGVLGMIFTLLVLSGINGSLDMRHSRALLEVDGQMESLESDIESLQSEADGLRQRLDSMEGLSARMKEAEEAVSDLNEETAGLAERTGTLNEELTAVSDDLALVSDELAEMEAQMGQVEDFFRQLQLLLSDSFGPVEVTATPMLTPTLTITSTPTVPTPTPWVTPTPGQ